MKRPLPRCLAASSRQLYDSTGQRFNHSTICLALIVCIALSAAVVRAEFSPPAQNSTRSFSGQFIVQGTPQFSKLAGSPRIAADTNLVRLDPALLVVSAERTKQSLWHALGINADAPWRGHIYFVLHPAQSPDGEVTVISQPFAKVWNYRVELPDVLPRLNFTRALASAVLLEYANRTAQSHSAEIPAWLVDGLSQQLLAAGSPETILSLPSKNEALLSVPSKTVDNLAVTRLNSNTSGIDPLAGARSVLKNSTALTFEQLSWPTDAQLSGDDGGVYRASAQLFISELLKLKNGPAQLRTMLTALPRFYNWQLAFQSAFRANFQHPLDLEKWWALAVVNFVSLDPGPGWTLEVSQQKLNDILSVPVEVRATTNNLPAHMEISLQAVLRNFDSARQSAILQIKLRDLELAQLRIAPQLAAVTDGYRRALAGYLGERNSSLPRRSWIKRVFTASPKASAGETIKKLNALDARRRVLETPPEPARSVQLGVESQKLN
jgi:hypothetical protein